MPDGLSRYEGLLVSLFGSQADREAAGKPELIVTVRRPDEFEILMKENERLTVENQRLRDMLASAHDDKQENIVLHTQINIIKKWMRQKKIAYPEFLFDN
jgi:UDP-N-acetylmuramyl tripeptide synthase